MSMADRVTMKVRPETRKRLKVYAAKNDEDYDGAINQLLDRIEDVEA